MSLNVKIISIEGNIGSGKTTLLKNLKDYFKNNENVIFLKEPVDEWEKIKDNNGTTILEKFYNNQEKYSFTFQIMAFISRLKIIRDTFEFIKSKDKDNSLNNNFIIITERCLYTDKHVFAQMLFDQSKIEDICYQVYLNWFDEFAKDYPINYTIYVNTLPEICYDRIHKRSRQGEETIPITYLKDCHKYHEEFINSNFCQSIRIYLDGNIDIYEQPDELKKWITHIEKCCGIV